MPERTEMTLLANFPCLPEKLMEIRKRVPLSEDGYIPLKIFHRRFTVVEPTFTILGDGAVCMSLGRPFGFMRKMPGRDDIFLKTPQTDGIDLVASPNFPQQWTATLYPDCTLRVADIELFSYGLVFYAVQAMMKRKK